MNPLKRVAASLSVLLVALGAAAPAMAFVSGTAPKYDAGCTFYTNGLTNNDWSYTDGFMTWDHDTAHNLENYYNATYFDYTGSPLPGASLIRLIPFFETEYDMNDAVSAILVPQGCQAYVWEHINGYGSPEWFPPGFHNLIGTSWNDKISTVYCPCSDKRTDSNVAFNGTSTYAKAPSKTWFSGGDFSITAWVYPTEAQYFARVIDFGNGANQDNIILTTSVSESGKPRFGIYKNGTEKVVDAPSALTLNTWTHIAAVYSAGSTTGKLYINGDLVATNTSMPAPANVTRTLAYIGKSNWSSDELFKGSLADVRVLNGYALAQDELQSLIAGADYPSTEIFTYEAARYRLASGSTWYDGSINQADATTY